MTDKTIEDKISEDLFYAKMRADEQEKWYDSEEFRTARGNWVKSNDCRPVEEGGVPFEQSKYYADARFLYKKRVQKNPV